MRFLLFVCNLGVGVVYGTLDTPDLVLERVLIVMTVIDVEVEVGKSGPKQMTVLFWCVMILEKHSIFPARDD